MKYPVTYSLDYINGVGEFYIENKQQFLDIGLALAKHTSHGEQQNNEVAETFKDLFNNYKKVNYNFKTTRQSTATQNIGITKKVIDIRPYGSGKKPDIFPLTAEMMFKVINELDENHSINHNMHPFVKITQEYQTDKSQKIIRAQELEIAEIPKPSNENIIRKNINKTQLNHLKMYSQYRGSIIQNAIELLFE